MLRLYKIWSGAAPSSADQKIKLKKGTLNYHSGSSDDTENLESRQKQQTLSFLKANTSKYMCVLEFGVVRSGSKWIGVNQTV